MMNNKMPKVSVILPSYNYAQYLDERIQSILNQTYQDFELIIVDDASTDNSVEVINQYTSDPRVKTQFFSDNSGSPYKRWNDGSELATGEYILFAGADDSCHSTLLEKLIEKLDHNPTVGIAFSQSWEINSQGQRLRVMTQCTDDVNKDHWLQDYVNSGKDECRYLMIKNTIPNASAVMLRRQIFETAGKFDEKLRLVADWMLWAKMLLISDVAYVAEPLNYFRRHKKTVRSGSQAFGLHILEEVQVVAFIAENVLIQSAFSERAYDRIANRWVNSISRLVLTKPSLVKEKAVNVYRLIRTIDPKINQRLFKRIIKDIATFGILTWREHTLCR
jgi:glycosyltransferase involved in cell wall biosynthesis